LCYMYSYSPPLVDTVVYLPITQILFFFSIVSFRFRFFTSRACPQVVGGHLIPFPIPYRIFSPCPCPFLFSLQEGKLSFPRWANNPGLFVPQGQNRHLLSFLSPSPFDNRLRLRMGKGEQMIWPRRFSPSSPLPPPISNSMFLPYFSPSLSLTLLCHPPPVELLDG